MGSLVLSNSQNLNQSGFSGYGSILTVSRREADQFPGSFVGALMGITAINVRTNVIPSYHMRSKGRFQSFAPGLRDGGEIAAAVNWLPGANDTQGQYAAEWSLLRQATSESNELTRIRVFAPDPDLHLIRVDGFLTQLGPFSYQPEAIMSGQVGWKIVGVPDIITPLVFDVSESSYVVKLKAISGANASESGSVATTIKLAGETIRGSTSGLALGVTYTDTASEEVMSVSISGGLTAGQPVAPGDGWIRLYIPGQYELWLPHGTESDDAFLLGGTDATVTGTAAEQAAITASNERLALERADVIGFQSSYEANGNKCFAAVYGSDDTL